MAKGLSQPEAVGIDPASSGFLHSLAQKGLIDDPNQLWTLWGDTGRDVHIEDLKTRPLGPSSHRIAFPVRDPKDGSMQIFVFGHGKNQDTYSLRKLSSDDPQNPEPEIAEPEIPATDEVLETMQNAFLEIEPSNPKFRVAPPLRPDTMSNAFQAYLAFLIARTNNLFPFLESERGRYHGYPFNSGHREYRSVNIPTVLDDKRTIVRLQRIGDVTERGQHKMFEIKLFSMKDGRPTLTFQLLARIGGGSLGKSVADQFCVARRSSETDEQYMLANYENPRHTKCIGSEVRSISRFNLYGVQSLGEEPRRVPQFVNTEATDNFQSVYVQVFNPDGTLKSNVHDILNVPCDEIAGDIKEGMQYVDRMLWTLQGVQE